MEFVKSNAFGLCILVAILCYGFIYLAVMHGGEKE